MSEKKHKICPHCGTVMVLQEDVIYTSLPPKYGYMCPICGALEFDTERIENESQQEILNNVPTSIIEQFLYNK